MEDIKKAKILLAYGTLKDYFEHCANSNYDLDLYINEIDIHHEAYEASQTQFEEAEIRDNWDDAENRAYFIEEGYSRDDIKYDDWDEAGEDILEETAYNIAKDIAEKHFDSDMDMITAIQEYLLEWK